MDLYFLSEIRLLRVSHSRRTNLDFYRICGCSASTLPQIIQLFQNSMRDLWHFRRTNADFYRICGCSASHLPHKVQLFQHRMRDVWHSRRTYINFYRICACPVSNLTSYYSLIAVSYRSVHLIRVSTRKILALRGLCAYCVFDPRFVSCRPIFADLSVVRRRSARCLLKLRSRLRQTQNRIQQIDPSRTVCSILFF